MAEQVADDLTIRTGLDADQRRERAARAGTQAHTISNYVARICKRAPELSAEDLDALRQIIGPVGAPDVYADGVRAGARMALERIVRLATEAV